jgi:hypothetical protein
MAAGVVDDGETLAQGWRFGESDLSPVKMVRAGVGVVGGMGWGCGCQHFEVLILKLEQLEAGIEGMVSIMYRCKM